MFIGTCHNINRYTTTDDWATVNSQLTIASPFNTGIIYDHGGFLNFASNQYDATTGVTSTKFHTGSGFDIWEILGTDLFAAQQPFVADTQIFRFTGAASGVRMAGVSAPTYSVNFDANGGSGTMQAQSSSVQAALNANTFSNSGNSFAGWNTAANGSGTAYADQASYPFSASVTLYAQWTTNSQVVNTPQVTSDGLVVTSWIRASGIFGSTARLTLRGNELQLVNSAQSSSSNIRIVNQSSNMLELEISEAALGLGWVQLNSPNRTITVQDAFVFSEREANVSSVQKTLDYSVRFAGNSSFISSQTRQRLMSLMQTSSTPLSIVITGSVSSRALSAADKALALKRAKAVARLASKAFPEMQAQVKISPAKGISALNRSAMIRIELSSKG
jgi:outer membrane protein OmpA-like peptidoglycan-associated protein